MDEILQTIWKHLHDKIAGLLVAALFTLIGWYWGKRKLPKRFLGIQFNK